MSEDRFNIFPTRMNYKITEFNISSAKRGHSLLKAKSDVLQTKFKFLEDLLNQKSFEVEKLFKKAFIIMARAEYYGGNIDLFLKFCENSPLTIETKIEQICGVVLPRFIVIKQESSEKEIFQTAGSKLNESKEAFSELLNILVELSSLRNSYIMIKNAFETANRRTKAIEHMLIPKLENTLQFISSELDEQERDEFHRLKKIQSINKFNTNR